MSEEIKNAALNIPRAIMFSLYLNGALGFAMVVAFMYALGDLGDAIDTPTGYSVFPILTGAFNSSGGACAVVALLAFMQTFSTTSAMAAASRQLWAFSRDRAVPGWSFLVHVSFLDLQKELRVLMCSYQVDHNKRLPVRAVAVSAVIPSLLMLIILARLLPSTI